MNLRSQSLNGVWNITTDDGEGFINGFENGKDVMVPGSIATVYDTVGGVYWYQKRFTANVTGERYWLNFAGVEYICDVYLNGVLLGSHEGKDTSFVIEATEAIIPNEENLLTIRVCYPIPGTVVDGFDGRDVLGKTIGGGVYGDVNLSVSGVAYIKYLQAYGNIHTGDIEITPVIDGEASRYEAEIWDNREGIRSDCEMYSGDIEKTLCFHIDEPRLWSPESPNLYNIIFKIYDSEGWLSDTYRVRTGFREFKVDADGSYMLNGKRILLKCAHGGCHTVTLPSTREEGIAEAKNFVIQMKAAGFNCIRYLQSIFTTQVFDLCDEMGLMVYQEHGSSWIPNGYPVVMASEARQPEGEVERKFYNDLTQQILEDRNHPSIVMWGLLNETVYCRRYEAARAALPIVRALDKTRLVLLSSGSWDADLDNGSVCNPFSTNWECLWGEEGTDHQSVQLFEDKAMRRNNTSESMPFIAAGYYTGAGDAHCYPCAQVNTLYFDWMEKLGSGTHPVFLSEYGVGSLFNYPALARRLESMELTQQDNRQYIQAHNNQDTIKKFISDFKLENVYPTPFDLIEDSYREQTKYREQTFSMIRSNPNIIGYSMTAVQDHGFAGEGFLGLQGEFKPGAMETMQVGWAPLRWCMLTNPTHAYADEPIRLRCVLADEDVLKPGVTYPITLKIYNGDVTIWQKKLHLKLTERPEGKKQSLAHTILDKTLTIKGLTPGKWTFSAELEKGAFARGGKVEFDVSAKEELPDISSEVFVAGELDPKVAELLYNHGITLKEYTIGKCDSLIVGKLNDKEMWDKVYDSINDGTKALFLDPYSLTEQGERYAYLDESKPAVYLRREDGSKTSLVSNWEWLYHRVPICRPGALTQTVQARGILDQNYYNNVLDQIYFDMETLPDDPSVMAFEMDVTASSGVGALIGNMLGRINYGKGSYIYNCLDIIGNIGQPAADKLLMNFINQIL